MKGSPWQLKERSPPLIPSTSKLVGCTSPPPNNSLLSSSSALRGFLREDPVLSSLVTSVTVVLEGRSICHRINLHSHVSYASLARALRQMFGNCGGAHRDDDDVEEEVGLGNAVPGHLVAYEDLENDLLLAGDLSWNDFVRVAKRIRIVPSKPRCNKKPTTTGLKQATP